MSRNKLVGGAFPLLKSHYPRLRDTLPVTIPVRCRADVPDLVRARRRSPDCRRKVANIVNSLLKLRHFRNERTCDLRYSLDLNSVAPHVS